MHCLLCQSMSANKAEHAWKVYLVHQQNAPQHIQLWCVIDAEVAWQIIHASHYWSLIKSRYALLGMTLDASLKSHTLELFLWYMWVICTKADDASIHLETWGWSQSQPAIKVKKTDELAKLQYVIIFPIAWLFCLSPQVFLLVWWVSAKVSGCACWTCV